ERRGAALGLAGSAAGAGSLFGPAFAALCAVASIAAVLTTLGALSLALCVALYVAGEAGDERRDEAAASVPFGERTPLSRIARPLGVILVCGSVLGAVATLAPLQLAHLGAGVAAIAAVFSLSAVGEIFASPFAGHLSDLVGRMPPMRVSLLLAIPLLALQATTGSPWVMAAAVAFTGTVVASLWPLGTALLADESSAANRSPAGAFAASVIAWSAGLVVGSLLCSALAEGAGEGAAYAALVVGCALSLLSLLGTSPRPARVAG
ncbi:MAG: MFS transporter, partial [Solirubrobacterales bacterium]